MSKPKTKIHLPSRAEWKRSQPEMPRPIPPFESQEYQDYRIKLEEWAQVGRLLDLSEVPRTGSINKKDWNNALS